MKFKIPLKIKKYKFRFAGKLIRYFAYFIIFVFFAYFFTLLLLPYGLIRKTAEKDISAKTGVKVSIGNAGYSFPFDIRFKNIDISDKSGKVRFGGIGSAGINVSPLVLTRLIFGTANLDARITSINLNAFNAGFMKVPPLKLGKASVSLAVYLKGAAGGGRSQGPMGPSIPFEGNIFFNGDLTGSVTGLNAVFFPRNGLIRFKSGRLSVKPSLAAAKALSLVFNMLFKKGTGGIYTYSLKNKSF